MSLPIMPKATAVWLVENTALTFDQIADFTGMHELEIQAIADGEVASGIVGENPLTNGELTSDEIKRCEEKPNSKLKISKSNLPKPKIRSKGARYTPVSKRQERPDAISWILKNHPELSEAQICRLLRTTKQTVISVKDKTHWNAQNINPQNPVILGLCNEAELQKAVSKANKKKKKLEEIESK
ncbi:MAG: cytoplasmic protein [Alphaproteobacteria bacterium TMED87]|nr:cytoplasmic protein [Rhodospirillaceae bacterium]OUV10059.1 MAG: cytoplasmic protein [Alphaproteobacteria bacterium TMED87]